MNPFENNENNVNSNNNQTIKSCFLNLSNKLEEASEFANSKTHVPLILKSKLKPLASPVEYSKSELEIISQLNS